MTWYLAPAAERDVDNALEFLSARSPPAAVRYSDACFTPSTNWTKVASTDAFRTFNTTV